MRKVLLLLALAAVGALVLAAPIVADDDDGGRKLTTDLNGAEEVPGPGDPDGSGLAKIKPDAEDREICYKIKVRDIQPATMAHIHRGQQGTAGPVVVNLEPPSDGSSKGCTTAERSLIKDISKNPSNFYVNIHNAEYPAGALRGQL